ncbi:hypothetical protein [Streptosporangium sp. NPDC049078]|uniref:hypothetical protein n=1 Tax=Streptosporangium sp. NPDC049078 TaxID=3155767 RepID=UPI0034361408
MDHADLDHADLDHADLDHADHGLGRIGVCDHPADRTVTSPAQLDGLGLEPVGERAARDGLVVS